MPDPLIRTLSGSSHTPQHLAEYRLPSGGITLSSAPAPRGEQFLIFNLKSRIACFHDGLAWHQDENQLAWLTPTTTVTLRSAGLKSAEVLIWRFNRKALPVSFQKLLPWPSRTPFLAPERPRDEIIQLIRLLHTRDMASGCRDIWFAAKLMELLGELLPAIQQTPTPRDAAPPAPRPHASVARAIAYMESHLADNIGLNEIATAAYASPSHLSRLFTAELSLGPTQYLRKLRMEHAAALLRSGRTNVTEAALAVGYSSLGQFSRVFQEHHGHPPSTLLRPAGD